MAAHVSNPRIYFGVFGALIVGTILTYWVSTFDLGPFNDIVALAIAVAKGTLVVLFFMHVRDSTRLTKLTVVAGFFWLLIMVGLTLSDYATRGWLDTTGASFTGFK